MRKALICFAVLGMLGVSLVGCGGGQGADVAEPQELDVGTGIPKPEDGMPQMKGQPPAEKPAEKKE